MIFDTICNAKKYAGINSGVDKILEAVKQYTSDNYPQGRVSLDGDALFMNFANYETHHIDDAVMEAHRKYIDVMYMVEGSETIYVKPTDRIKNVTKEYDPEIEALLGEVDDDVTAVRLETGCFIALFPQDAHAPACFAEGPCNVKKIIGKVFITD